MPDTSTQLQRHLIRTLSATPRWLLHALAEGGCATAEGAREEVVNRILRALEPWELRPRRVCPYTGNVILDPDQRALPLGPPAAAAPVAEGVSPPRLV